MQISSLYYCIERVDKRFISVNSANKRCWKHCKILLITRLLIEQMPLILRLRSVDTFIRKLSSNKLVLRQYLELYDVY